MANDMIYWDNLQGWAHFQQPQTCAKCGMGQKGIKDSILGQLSIPFNDNEKIHRVHLQTRGNRDDVLDYTRSHDIPRSQAEEDITIAVGLHTSCD
jgi:hypothetical protein